MGWKRLGPGGGGAMYIPTVHPGDENTAFIACDMTGSYLTKNGGKDWRQINFHGRVLSFCYDPHFPDTLYAGSSGLYRSLDAGNHWELLYPPPGAVTEETTLGDHASHAFLTSTPLSLGNVEAICCDPVQQGCIWIGLNSSKLANYFTQGSLTLLCSRDGGATWSQGLPLSGAGFVKIIPLSMECAIVFTDTKILRVCLEGERIAKTVLRTSSTRILDAAYGFDPQGGHYLYFYTEQPALQCAEDFHSHVYRSQDEGNTWTELKSGLTEDYAAGQKLVYSRIAVSALDARVVYLSLCEPMAAEDRVAGAESFFGIFKSEDAGDHFSWSLRIGEKNPTNRSIGWVERDYGTGWGGAPFGLGVCEGKPGVCYATDWGTCYRTVDGGLRWEQLYTHTHPDGTSTSRGLDVTLVYHLHFDPHQPEHIAIACTDIGLFDSANDGQSWRHCMKGVPDKWKNSCYCLVFDPDVQGRAWSVWTNCHDLPRPKMFLNGGFAKRLGGVCKSEDGLATWDVSSRGLEENIAPTCILLDPKSPVGQRTLYVAAMGGGVYRSRDDGVTWTPCNVGLGSQRNAWKIFLAGDGTLYVLIARGLEDGRETDGMMYRSTDGADSWEALPMPGLCNAPNFLAIDAYNPMRMFLACWPRVLEGREGWGGLYRSEDAGTNWENVYDAASHVYGVALDSRHPTHVYCTNFENMALFSKDNGDHFTRLPGFDFKWAHQPVLHPVRASRLYVATFGSGLWLFDDEEET